MSKSTDNKSLFEKGNNILNESATTWLSTEKTNEKNTIEINNTTDYEFESSLYPIEIENNSLIAIEENDQMADLMNQVHELNEDKKDLLKLVQELSKECGKSYTRDDFKEDILSIVKKAGVYITDPDVEESIREIKKIVNKL